jgi:CubicO group peptidase (beta-lactamase class C family)
MEDVMYGREIMDALIPAANGFFDARSLATMYAMLAGRGALGSVRLLSPETVDRLSAVQNDRPDRVVVFPMQWRLGYHRVITSRGLPRTGFGHFGFGGSGGWADPSLDVAMAMVCNRGTGTPIGDLRIAQLSTEVIGSARTASRQSASVP